MSKYAVILFNLGGPDSLEAIEPFLYNLFRDPDIFKIPVGQKLFAKIISKRRAPKVSEEYKLIGGSSPINEWTEKQRNLLESELNNDLSGNSFEVFTAMRYWHPLTDKVADEIAKREFEKIVLLPLYPHYSITTTGSSFNEWKRVYKKSDSNIIKVKEYFDQPKYIDALNERIDKTLLKFPEGIRDEVQLVFSAHGTPVSLVKNGDPYSVQIKKTVEKVMEGRNHSHEYHQCYQSKVGPVKWLEPATDTMIEELSAEGKKHLLIIPISFVSDHVETLFELDIEYRHVADEAGVKNYIMMEGLNDSPIFIQALKEITLDALNKNEK